MLLDDASNKEHLGQKLDDYMAKYVPYSRNLTNPGFTQPFKKCYCFSSHNLYNVHLELVGKRNSFLAERPKPKEIPPKKPKFRPKAQNSSFLSILLMLNRTKVEAEVIDRNTLFGQNWPNWPKLAKLAKTGQNDRNTKIKRKPKGRKPKQFRFSFG